MKLVTFVTRLSASNKASTLSTTACVWSSDDPGSLNTSTANWLRSTFGNSCWSIVPNTTNDTATIANPTANTVFRHLKALSMALSYTDCITSRNERRLGLPSSDFCLMPFFMNTKLRYGTISRATITEMTSAMATTIGMHCRNSPAEPGIINPSGT